MYMASTLNVQKEIPGHKAIWSEILQSRPKLSSTCKQPRSFFFFFFGQWWGGNKKLLRYKTRLGVLMLRMSVWPCRLLNSIGFSKGEHLTLSSILIFKGTCWGTVIMTYVSRSHPQFFSEELSRQSIDLSGCSSHVSLDAFIVWWKICCLRNGKVNWEWQSNEKRTEAYCHHK